jgi:hypothetical protein
MTKIILVQGAVATGVQGVGELRHPGAGFSDVAHAAPEKMLLQTKGRDKGARQ